MEEGFEHVVYSRNVIEFVTVANEFCASLESCEKSSKRIFIEKCQKLLPLLYLKGSLLPKVDTLLEEEIEKFVTEADYDYIKSIVQRKMGEHDEYLEVFDDAMQESESPVVAAVSENFADIYQDLKDFLTSYRIGNLDIMNDALWALKDSFDQYWGQTTVNVLRAVHNLLTKGEDIDLDLTSGNDSSTEELDLSDSIISQRQKQWGDQQ